MFWILLVVVILIAFLFHYRTKRLKVGCVTMINGAVKTGKTLLAVKICIKEHKKSLFKYYINKYILMKHDYDSEGNPIPYEKPLLYANIPLKYKYYTPLTKEHIMRTKRLNFRSTTLLSEMSLVANSMMYKNEVLNEEIEAFMKLYGHETKGGKLICETQSIEDNHYAVKRSLSQYLYIHSSNKCFPFFVVMKVREMIYSSDNQSAVNVFNTDLEDSLKTIILPKKYYKVYDRYGFSCLTDDLDTGSNELPYDSNMDLKARKVLSFRDFKSDAFKCVKKGEDTNGEKTK